MMNVFTRFVKDESGATAIEYGLIAALIAVVLITALTSLGSKASATFESISAQLGEAGGGESGGGESGGESSGD